MVYTAVYDADGRVEGCLYRHDLEGEEDDAPTPAGAPGSDGGPADWSQLMTMEEMIMRGRGRSGRERRVPAVAPLRRVFSGVSTEMRADNSDFLTGVGETYELQDSGALVARRDRQRSRGDSLDMDFSIGELEGDGSGEGGDGSTMDVDGSGAVHNEDGSMVRMRSVGGLSRPGFDRPPRIRVQFRLRQLSTPSSRSPTAAYTHTQHPHPVALASGDFSKRFPAAKQPGNGWTCDGKLGSAGTRPCRHHGNGNVGRYRCTMGCDYDLCETCFESGVRVEVDEKVKRREERARRRALKAHRVACEAVGAAVGDDASLAEAAADDAAADGKEPEDADQMDFVKEGDTEDAEDGEDDDPELQVPFTDIEVQLSEDGSMQTLFQAIQNMSDSYTATMAKHAAAKTDGEADSKEAVSSAAQSKTGLGVMAEKKKKAAKAEAGAEVESTDGADETTIKAVPWRAQYTLEYMVVVEINPTPTAAAADAEVGLPEPLSMDDEVDGQPLTGSSNPGGMPPARELGLDLMRDDDGLREAFNHWMPPEASDAVVLLKFVHDRCYGAVAQGLHTRANPTALATAAADPDGTVPEGVDLKALLLEATASKEALWEWRTLWRNESLDRKLLSQLKDPLSIATGAMPGWCRLVSAAAPFLFNQATRRRQLMCSAFGVSRAVEFLQQDEPHSATEGLTSRLTQLNERMVAMWMTGQDPQGLQG